MMNSLSSIFTHFYLLNLFSNTYTFLAQCKVKQGMNLERAFVMRLVLLGRRDIIIGKTKIEGILEKYGRMKK